MMRILLDTNVLSEITRPRPDPNVTAFLGQGYPTYISALTLHELKHGAALLKDENRSKKLLAWVTSIRKTFEKEILPMTADIAESAAVLRAEASHQGRVLHIEDAIIAATAIEHDLTLVSRNMSDFKVTGATLRNPWEGN